MNNTLKLAETALDDGNINEATAIVNNILGTDHSNVDALMLMVKIYYKKQKWGDALNTLNKVEEIDPNHKSVVHYRQMINSILNYWNKDNYNP